ncbi:sulfotransferase [bacterium]|nr:sulfotransferase [bacterium]
MNTLKQLAFLPRIMSASLRGLPQFIIIGAQKGGSSALYKFLCEHPQVQRAFVKEPHYFTGQFHQKSLKWYKAQFPLSKSGIITGEASPSYCTHPLAPQRIKSVVPQAKLIFIVRNPVERAVSNYFHSVRYGVEPLPIEEAMQRPAEIFEAEYAKMEREDGYHSSTYHRHAYLHKGLYAFHLNKWYQHFEPQQILLLENAELLNQPQKVYNEVLQFLQLEAFAPAAFSKHNVGSTKPVDESLTRQLKQVFEEPNRQFFHLISREFPW